MVKAAMVTLGCFWGESGCDKEWMVYTVEDESCWRDRRSPYFAPIKKASVPAFF